MKTLEKVKELKHTINTKDIDGNDMIIKISLDDDCKNEHDDFSITATIFEKGKPHTDKYFIAAGCCHDDILKTRPDLKIFVDLHLCQSNGAPMCAIDNGFYHLQQSTYEVAKDYIRATDKEMETIIKTKNAEKLYFGLILFQLGIVKRWEAEAKKAIAILEKLTGLKYENNDQPRIDKIIDEETLKSISVKVKNGEYTNKATFERAEAQKEALNRKILLDLKKGRDKAIEDARNEYNVCCAIAKSGLSLDNFIYHKHSNEGVFNWKGYEKQITHKEFFDFVRTVDYTKLPKNVSFKMGDKK